MTEPIYPADDFRRGSDLLHALGTFWTYFFEDAHKLQSHLRHQGWSHGQTYLDFLETVACLSRFTVPVFHKKNWAHLALKLSEMNTRPLYYGEGAIYGAQDGSDPIRPVGKVYEYGGPGASNLYEFPLPAGLKQGRYQILNRVIYPSVTWTGGLDFEIDLDKNIIRFRENPFNDALIAQIETYDDVTGDKTETEVSLWLYNSAWDLDQIYAQFGYAIGMRLNSSDFYRDLLNSFWSSFVAGPAMEYIQGFLSALSGLPMVEEAVEVVKVIRTETESKLVITNCNVYRFPLAATVDVSVEDTVHAGDTLVSDIEVIELAGNDPDYSSIPSISLGPQFLSGGYYGELVFENKTVTVDYGGLDADNRAIVTFEVSGFPADMEKFWTDAQTLGKTEGAQTLAALLDTRDNPTLETTAEYLPATINPVQFLVENFFANNMFLIRLNASAFSADAPGVLCLRYLRNVIAPHTTYLIYIELSPEIEYVEVSEAGTALKAGCQDTPTMLLSVAPSEETVYGNFLSHSGAACGEVHVRVWPVSLTCS